MSNELSYTQHSLGHIPTHATLAIIAPAVQRIFLDSYNYRFIYENGQSNTYNLHRQNFCFFLFTISLVNSLAKPAKYFTHAQLTKSTEIGEVNA